MMEVKTMLQGIRQRAVVDDQGRITISAPELPEGTSVEVIVLVEPEEDDETSYLMADEENRARLLRALHDLENPEKYTYVDPDEL